VSISNYSELKSAIADWLLRTDLTSVIPSFISMAEAQISRDVRDRRMVKRATAEIDTEYSQIPADWQETIRFELLGTPVAPLSFISPSKASEKKAQFVGSGKPQYFTLIGSGIQVVPAPDDTYQSELTYYAKIDALSDASPTNWLLTYAPDVYLYACLLQASPYLDNDERMGTWSSLYQRGVNGINLLDERASTGSAKLSMRAKPMA
jgi:hypothetical protein